MIISKQKLRTILPSLAVIPSGDVLNEVRRLPKPFRLGLYNTPNSLDELMLGQLFELQSIDSAKALTAPCEIILMMTERQVYDSLAVEVFGFNNWVASELERITKMFEQIPSKITSQERRAGAERLNFGLFGIVDNYARRMGVADHEYILDNVPWLRVWQVMNNDAQVSLYERRLRKIYSETK